MLLLIQLARGLQECLGLPPLYPGPPGLIRFRFRFTPLRAVAEVMTGVNACVNADRITGRGCHVPSLRHE